ncbi:hypothetical protein ACRRTK_018338 [Alexandromys fortis]
MPPPFALPLGESAPLSESEQGAWAFGPLCHFAPQPPGTVGQRRVWELPAA